MQSLGLSKIRPTQLISVESHPTICPYCHYVLEKGENSHLSLESVKRIEHGLISTGHVKCAFCGAALQTVKREIELAASTFQCPACRRTDTLEYQVESVEPRKKKDLSQGFNFEVKVTCSHCSHKKTFKSVIKAILDVIKLKIGPDGVEVSKAD